VPEKRKKKVTPPAAADQAPVEVETPTDAEVIRATIGRVHAPAALRLSSLNTTDK
jgi:hypothetical protein